MARSTDPASETGDPVTALATRLKGTARITPGDWPYRRYPEDTAWACNRLPPEPTTEGAWSGEVASRAKTCLAPPTTGMVANADRLLPAPVVKRTVFPSGRISGQAA